MKRNPLAPKGGESNISFGGFLIKMNYDFK